MKNSFVVAISFLLLSCYVSCMEHEYHLPIVISKSSSEKQWEWHGSHKGVPVGQYMQEKYKRPPKSPALNTSSKKQKYKWYGSHRYTEIGTYKKIKK